MSRTDREPDMRAAIFEQSMRVMGRSRRICAAVTRLIGKYPEIGSQFETFSGEVGALIDETCALVGLTQVENEPVWPISRRA